MTLFALSNLWMVRGKLVWGWSWSFPVIALRVWIG